MRWVRNTRSLSSNHVGDRNTDSHTGKVGMSVLTKGLAMDFIRQDRNEMAITSIWPASVSTIMQNPLKPTQVVIPNLSLVFNFIPTLTFHNLS